MIRSTTGGVLNSYRTNLMKSFITDNKARETVLTQRVFNSYAEDPAAAAKAFRLRKSRIMTSSQLKICDDTLHKYQGAFACLQKVSELIDTENGGGVSTLKSTTLEMLNDPTGDARVQLNKVLDNLDDTIIQNMNQTYGDEFIFAGADGHNVPFTVKETADGKKQLYYRGISVDAAGSTADAAKLKYLATEEKRFVDIGLGFQEDETGKLIESSAFNESLSGLTFLGYGVDKDGDPKNIYSIVQRLKDIAANVPEQGSWDKSTYDEFDRLVGKLEDAASEFKTQFASQSAGVEKLENTYDLLEDNVYNLKEQYSNLEDVDMADAITSFLWAEYCYNAALKVGNSVLSQSLMDYLQ